MQDTRHRTGETGTPRKAIRKCKECLGSSRICSQNEICHVSGLPMAQVSSTLAIMEIKGLVKQISSMNYILAREAREKYKVEID